MGNPAIGILHKNPEADLNQELLRRYRGKVEPKSYNYNLLEQYLDENFDYRERTVESLELHFLRKVMKQTVLKGLDFRQFHFLSWKIPKASGCIPHSVIRVRLRLPSKKNRVFSARTRGCCMKNCSSPAA